MPLSQKRKEVYEENSLPQALHHLNSPTTIFEYGECDKSFGNQLRVQQVKVRVELAQLR